MRRTRRIIVNGLAAISLLLAVGLSGSCVRSYWQADGWGRSRYLAEKRELRVYAVGSERGRVGFNYFCLRFNQSAELRVKEQGAGGSVYLVPYFSMTYSGEWKAAKVDVVTGPPQRWWERAGIYARRGEDPIRTTEPTGTSTMAVTVPYWMLVVVFSIWPGGWAVGWWRRRKKICAGLCLNCGYDLRASPQRCPECGAVAGGEDRN